MEEVPKEEKAAAEEAPAAEERAAKRRAVAKGKKPVQALQPVEHHSHQKVSLQAAADWSCLSLMDNMVFGSAYLIKQQPYQLQIEVLPPCAWDRRAKIHGANTFHQA